MKTNDVTGIFEHAVHETKRLQASGGLSGATDANDDSLEEWLPRLRNCLGPSELEMFERLAAADYPILIAVGSAIVFSLRYQADFEILPNEHHPYWRKSFFTALGYRGLAPNDDLQAAYGAGKAAFFCCAYDVVTDWRRFGDGAHKAFQASLRREVPADVAKIALTLYEQDRQGLLQLDGLARGIYAMTGVTRLIGSEEYIRQHFDFEQLSLILQIFDDVMDVENDERAGEVNCLLFSESRRARYLHSLLAFDVDRFERLLPRSAALSSMIRSTQQKAKWLLSIRAG